jgi:hypothetical protein
VLKEAVWTHKLLILKDQRNLHPKKNWELLTRLDPEAPILSQADFGKCFHPTGEGILVGTTRLLDSYVSSAFYLNDSRKRLLSPQYQESKMFTSWAKATKEKITMA